MIHLAQATPSRLVIQRPQPGPHQNWHVEACSHRERFGGVHVLLPYSLGRVLIIVPQQENTVPALSVGHTPTSPLPLRIPAKAEFCPERRLQR